MRQLCSLLVAAVLVGFLTVGSAEAGQYYNGAGWDRWGVYGTNWEAYGWGNYGYPYSGYGRAYGYSWGGCDCSPAVASIRPAGAFVEAESHRAQLWAQPSLIAYPPALQPPQ